MQKTQSGQRPKDGEVPDTLFSDVFRIGRLRKRSEKRVGIINRKDMEAKDLRIVYMGTPDFAVAPLRRLVEEGYRIVAVVTMPDKPSGRGLRLQPSAVKQYALQAGLPVLQPPKLERSRIRRTVPGTESRSGHRYRFPHASRSNLVGPATRHVQPPRLAAASVQRRGTDQLGDHRRQDRERRHDVPARSRDRQRRHTLPEPCPHIARRLRRHPPRQTHGAGHGTGRRNDRKDRLGRHPARRTTRNRAGRNPGSSENIQGHLPDRLDEKRQDDPRSRPRTESLSHCMERAASGRGGSPRRENLQDTSRGRNRRTGRPAPSSPTAKPR